MHFLFIAILAITLKTDTEEPLIEHFTTNIYLVKEIACHVVEQIIKRPLMKNS